MSSSSSRAYHSPRRQASARETRRLVLQATQQQFVRHGYAGTSLAAIARAAGVSLATVKLVAATKAQLLLAATQALVRGDESAVPLVEQPWWQQLLAEPDPDRLLRQFATATRSALERQADLLEVIRQAASSEPDIAELEQRASLGRWHDLRQLAQALADRDALRSDLDVDAAADIIWALASPQLYRPLVAGRRWSADRWEALLHDILRTQLLVPRRSQRRPAKPATLPLRTGAE
jgi:AcrR family transcriptional regulator